MKDGLSWGDKGGGYVCSLCGERRFRQGTVCKHKEHCGCNTERQDT